MSRAARICIVAPGHISCNPRVVKEADALAAAGYVVRVVGTQYVAACIPWDRELAATRNWHYEAIHWTPTGIRSRWRRVRSAVRQRFCRRLASCGVWHQLVLERAAARMYSELLAAVCRESADLISAHYVDGLAVAFQAAEQMRVAFAFDAEDDHFGEFRPDEQASLPARLVDRLQARCLPYCKYVTAASAGIAEALAARYRIQQPIPVYNVFPWSDRAQCDGQRQDRRGSGLSLCWFSQVVGLNRGIQDAIRAAGLVRGKLHIHIRGVLRRDVHAVLLELARQNSMADRIHFHEPVSPHALLSRTAEHDIGLAIEPGHNANNAATCSNKLFLYLLAGLAVAATDTAGQQRIMKTMPDVGFLYAPGDYRALAARLQDYVDRPELLARAKQAALAQARGRWNWEREREQLLILVAKALGDKPQPCLERVALDG
jgi:glycosyltransferase involved in cell wall biosynthesis